MKRILFVILSVCFLVSSMVQAKEASLQKTVIQTRKKQEGVVNGPNKLSRLNNSKRLMVYQPDMLVDMLGIRQGMSILDIGAGTGSFTFRMADKLDGTGAIYATEISDEKITYMQNKIKKQRYTNIQPVKVGAKGLDPFYKTISCDVILMCAVYEVIWEPKQYFSALRNSLKKDTGRLFIVYYNPDSNFSVFMFEYMEKTIERIISYGDENPVLRRLSNDSKAYIDQWKTPKNTNAEIPMPVKQGLVADFNRLLDDPSLLQDMITYSAMKNWANPPLPQLFIKSRDLRLAQWLIRDMDKKGFFSAEPPPKFLKENKKIVRTINRMMLNGLLSPMNIISLLSADHPIYFSREKVVKTIEAAGYKLVAVHDDLPQHDMIEFKRIQ